MQYYFWRTILQWVLEEVTDIQLSSVYIDGYKFHDSLGLLMISLNLEKKKDWVHKFEFAFLHTVFIYTIHTWSQVYI